MRNQGLGHYNINFTLKELVRNNTSVFYKGEMDPLISISHEKINGICSVITNIFNNTMLNIKKFYPKVCSYLNELEAQ